MPSSRSLSALALGLASSLLLGGCDRADRQAPARAETPAASPPSSSQPAAGSDMPEELVLMNWNVEWMWDGIAPEDGEIDFPRKGDVDAARAHVEAVAAVIRKVDPDIVNLVEVEGPDVLKMLVEDYLPNAGYEIGFVQGKDKATGQDLALLSRYPIGTMDREPTHGRSGKSRKRLSKNYSATVDVPTQSSPLRLGLVGLHFLARPDRESRKEPREAQADVVRKMAGRLVGQGRSVIVWGDFNDLDGTVPDRKRSKPITRVLDWIRALDPNDPSDDLGNAFSYLEQKDRCTNTYGTAIDHVLLSPDLYERIEEVEILENVKVSDHYPVIVRLDLS